VLFLFALNFYPYLGMKEMLLCFKHEKVLDQLRDLGLDFAPATALYQPKPISVEALLPLSNALLVAFQAKVSDKVPADSIQPFIKDVFGLFLFDPIITMHDTTSHADIPEAYKQSIEFLLRIALVVASPVGQSNTTQSPDQFFGRSQLQTYFPCYWILKSFVAWTKNVPQSWVDSILLEAGSLIHVGHGATKQDYKFDPCLLMNISTTDIEALEWTTDLKQRFRATAGLASQEFELERVLYLAYLSSRSINEKSDLNQLCNDYLSQSISDLDTPGQKVTKVLHQAAIATSILNLLSILLNSGKQLSDLLAQDHSKSVVRRILGTEGNAVDSPDGAIRHAQVRALFKTFMMLLFLRTLFVSVVFLLAL